jgi:hypothetical protein
MHTSLSHIQSASDLSIGLSLSSEQHDLRANHFTMRVYWPARWRNSRSSVSLSSITYLLATADKNSQTLWKSFNQPGTYFRRDH